jgi:subtilisin family serine protease
MQSSVISVAAIESDQSDTLLYNPRPPVDFGAPGINVPVAWRGGGTMTVLGNSYAAPHVTGHVARMLGQHRGLTPWHVKTLLRAISHNVRANVTTDAPPST